MNLGHRPLHCLLTRFFIKANILVDGNGHACLADFGFLAIVSDPANPTASSSYAIGGTTRWMSPELLTLNQSGLKNSRPTKQSDCYALGMVIYEVLSGRAPFSQFHHYVVIRKVVDGERPERPKGAEGAWFSNELWQMLTRCWATKPKSRPSVAAVLECLERVSRDSESAPPETDEDLGMDEDGWNRTSVSSRKFSWFNPRCFVALLRRILC
jgi:serine/threonine protein kinase